MSIDFADYFPNFDSSTTLEEIFEALGLDEKLRSICLDLLDPLKNISPITYQHYEHSVRVGWLCYQMAEFLGLDKRAFTFAGLFHDIGKASCDLSILGKKSEWTAEDADHMKKHVMETYRILLKYGLHFTAQIIVYHHYHQENGYPEIIPELLHDYSDETQSNIVYYGRLLAIADVYDALHRRNEKNDHPLNGEEMRARLIASNTDQQELISRLYEAGIFTTLTID